MVKKIIQSGLVVVFLSLLAINVHANNYTINELIENGKRLDMNIVVLEAEAIGEVLERGDYAWVNVNDKTNAIGIWVTKEDASQLEYFGDYHHIGDQVRIIGQFHQACTEHGGEMDIHATAFTIVASGYDVEHPVSQSKLYITAGLLAIAVFLGITNYKRILIRSRKNAGNE